MDRNTVIRWLVIAAVLLVFWKWGLPLISGKSSSEPAQNIPAEEYKNAPDFVPDVIDDGKSQPPEGKLCTIHGNRYDAELSSRGAALTHFFLLDQKYATSPARDLSTTPDHERWRSLRTLFRGQGADDQLKYDRFNWDTEQLGDAGCRFTYTDEDVKIVKTVTASTRPYEVSVQTDVTNLTDAPKKHQYSLSAFAFRTNKDMKGSLGRVSPFETELSCAREGDVVRKPRDKFKEGWFAEPLADRYAAVSSYYFAQALVPMDAPANGKPSCELLAELHQGPNGEDVDNENAGTVFHAELLYPAKTLAPNETATYSDEAFFGPKERDVLAQAAGGQAKLGDLIDLGFFTPVAKVIVTILTFIHAKITLGNWGVAIIVLTIALRTLLFPLTFKSIKSGIAMRKLKPEMDALTKKFEGDMQAKNLAVMELYKKKGVSPLGGCLPQMVQLPVWWAMYRTLQTAVEMYNQKFMWFADLSAPDKYFVLPVVLGGFMILQQRLVPQQGMDPMQQKMMNWMLPVIFTVMMLFLPAALGVYMLTNSMIAIVQTLAVEKFAPRNPPAKTSGSDIVVKQQPMAAVGKGKARV
jgi:YidC/Oxa1 family membrane protein insertase